MGIRIDDIMLTEFELTALEAGGAMLKHTLQGERIWFYGEGSEHERPEGSWRVPVGAFMARELRTGGKSGYTHPDYPFLLDIKFAA